MTRHEFIRELILKLQSEARKGERFTWHRTNETSVFFDFEAEEISREDLSKQLELILPRIHYTVQLIFPGVKVEMKQRYKHDTKWCLEIDANGALWRLNE